MRGKCLLLPGETCRSAGVTGNPIREGRLNLQESAEAIVLRAAQHAGRAERQNEGLDLASSRDTQRRQPSWQQTCLWEETVNTSGPTGEPSAPPARTKEEPCEVKVDLLEQVLDYQNIMTALKRVEENKGAPGIDGMKTKELRSYLAENWNELRSRLLEGTYEPQPVRRVEIPKPNGGKRLLGIPTVTDRLIQQALLQVLTPIFDPGFSESSYGFRPGRRGHDAVRTARQHMQEGYTWVVDMDLESFFDRVNHDILMARVARKVQDRRVLKVIRAYLNAGVMINGVIVTTEEGTPQGGPLSPLLANVLLDDLDKEIERRGHRFCRYADDANIYVRSRRAGERVLASIRNFLETRLKLKVNEAKSAVDRPWKRKFLGFSFYWSKNGIGIRLAPQTIERVKQRIRELTRRRCTLSIQMRIKQINSYLGGWLGYFALADAKRVLTELDQWLRHRLRACEWTLWKRVRTRYRELRHLGLSAWRVHNLANARKGPWRMAQGPLNSVLTASWFDSLGLINLIAKHHEIRQNWRTAGCGPACPVV